MSKSDAGNAERAAEHYAREVLGCVVTRRAIKARFNKVDFFGADVMGRLRNGAAIWIQVTASKTTDNVSHRKRKLEKIPWGPADRVYMIQFKTEKVGRVRLDTFRVQRLYYGESEWTECEPCPVPRAWFRAWRPEA